MYLIISICLFTGKTVDTIQKQSTLCYDNYTEDQTTQYALKENTVPVLPNCYSMFARQKTRKNRIQMLYIAMAVVCFVAIAIILVTTVPASQKVRKSIKK